MHLKGLSTKFKATLHCLFTTVPFKGLKYLDFKRYSIFIRNNGRNCQIHLFQTMAFRVPLLIFKLKKRRHYLLFLSASRRKAVHCCTRFCSINTSTIWVISAKGSSSWTNIPNKKPLNYKNNLKLWCNSIILKFKNIVKFN